MVAKLGGRMNGPALYSLNLPLRIAGHLSSFCLGAVLSHILLDETERPVAFASQTLSPVEKKTTLNWTGRSIVFDVRRFHQYN